MAIKKYVVDPNTNLVKAIHKVVVHRFRLGDVEDPEIYAAEPLYRWQQSDAGKFIMANSWVTPEYHRHLDQAVYGYTYVITAELEEKKLSEFYLRFGQPVNNQ
jgi:hypothetical protein